MVVSCFTTGVVRRWLCLRWGGWGGGGGKGKEGNEKDTLAHDSTEYTIPVISRYILKRLAIWICWDVNRDWLPLQGLGNSVDAAAELEDVSGVTRNDLDTDEVEREREIGVQLKDLNEKLKREVTFLLQVPEVKEDKLKTAVKLDLLTRLSESLQDMYSDIQAMVAETCKCNEDLKREFYDFAYHGLRAEHNDLVLRVKDLESSQAEMSDEEKKAFKRLQQYQINRQRQIDRLENVWRGLFSSVRKYFVV